MTNLQDRGSSIVTGEGQDTLMESLIDTGQKSPVQSDIFQTELKIADIHSASLSSNDIFQNRMPDWYFLAIIAILVVMIWIKLIYNKFLDALIQNSYNYQLANKSFRERNIVQVRFGLTLDFIYLINVSLFILSLSRYFKWDLPLTGSFEIFIASVGILLSLMLIRIAMMRITGFVFNRYSLFSESLFHHFIYTKLLGIVLIPFVICIPYTTGLIHISMIIIALIISGMIWMMRIIRQLVFISKNAVLLFYLILYLCTLELLPLVVIMKIILSLK